MEREIRFLSGLVAWKVNYALVLMVYKITKKFPREEKFGLIDQLKKSSKFRTANIAEGWGRYHYADKIRLYYQSRGSNCEVQN